MDNATKRSLKKQDQFITFTEDKIAWAQRNRRLAAIAGALVVAAILLIVGGVSLYQQRTAAAETAFGAAMQTYQTPVASAAQPIPPGMKSFPTTAARAAAANAAFVQVAGQYGFTAPGKLAEYFAGLTYMEEGKNGPAAEALNKTASSWDSGLAALGKMALAQLDQQTGKDAEAVSLYNELAKGHATTVPAGLAQLQLAELYEAQGKTAQAREIYADLKDHDKDAKGQPGAAGEIASAKLNPQAQSQAQ